MRIVISSSVYIYANLVVENIVKTNLLEIALYPVDMIIDHNFLEPTIISAQNELVVGSSDSVGGSSGTGKDSIKRTRII